MNVTYLKTQYEGREIQSATVTTERGSAIVLVTKVERLNPSARGGAYRTEWQCSARGRKVYADTRKAAVEAGVASLRERGWAI